MPAKKKVAPLSLRLDPELVERIDRASKEQTELYVKVFKARGDALIGTRHVFSRAGMLRMVIEEGLTVIEANLGHPVPVRGRLLGIKDLKAAERLKKGGKR